MTSPSSEVDVPPLPNRHDATHRRRHWLRFSLRTFLIAFTVLTVYLGWNVYLVRQRTRLLDHRAEHGAHIVMNWEGDASAPQAVKDRVAPTVITFFKSRNRTQTDPTITLLGPDSNGELSFLRRTLGDEQVAWIVLTNWSALDAYRQAFPEATIVVDATAQASIDQMSQKMTAWKLSRQGAAGPTGD